MSEQAKTTLAGALLAFQKDAPELHNNSDGNFNNRYISLAALVNKVRPALNAAGLVVVQQPTTLDGVPALRTKLIHAESGDAEEDVMPLLLDRNNAQGLGSALTYARRHSLMAILGLVADEDDDANAAAKPAGPQAAHGQPTSTQQETTDGSDAVVSPAAPSDGGNPSAVVLTFGKHSGKRVADVPVAYLKWWSEQEEPKTPELRRVRAAVNIFLKQAA